MKVGFHISVAGSVDLGVDRAASLNCNTFQIFTRNPRQWYSANLTKETAKTFSDKVKSYGIEPIFAHMPYLPNLASPRDEIYRKSVKVLTLELERCRHLEIPYLITHLGSHLGLGFQKGLKRLINAINQSLKEADERVTLLLENTAGTRNSMGSTFEDIQNIIKCLFQQDRIGVCFDTSHAFAAGYDLRTEEMVQQTIEKIEDIIGFEKLKIIHLNDSKGEFYSHIDRHEHIGKGQIGLDGFRNIVTHPLLRGLPFILETPTDELGGYEADLPVLRSLRKAG